MRLHRLTATAFGPFAETVAVDFDALATSGLFLFHGPTGAGKTSILDAVCFALYGQVPGARQQARSLRSDHAPRGMRPQVRLEATLRGRRFRITRSPAWERAKQRGHGTTTEQARVLVEELEGDLASDRWVTRATRLDESGLLLGDLLGLGREQFCQVVLLPQGQFAEFLRADADRRRDLLETLFGTKRFTAVERWLVEQRQDVARSLDSADHAVSDVVARAEQAAGVSTADGAPTPDTAAPWLGHLVTTGQVELDAAAAELDAATGQRASAETTLARARRTTDLKLRHRALLERRAALSTAQPARDRAEGRLLAARTVAPVLPLLAEAQRLRADLEAARLRAEATHLGLAGFLAATGTAGAVSTSTTPLGTGVQRSGAGSDALPEPVVISRLAATARAEVGALGQLAEQEAEADQLRAATDRLEQTVVSLQTDAERVGRWLDEASRRRDVLVDHRERALVAATAMPLTLAALEEATERRLAGQRRDQLSDDVRRVGDALREAVDAAQHATEHWLALRQRRLDGMAAELAAGLADGAPCPVCGSAEHPATAQGSPDRVTPDAEDSALDAADAARAHRDRVRDELTALERAFVEARQSAGGDAGLDELAAVEHTARQRLDELSGAAAALPQARAAVERFDEEREAQVREQVRVAEQLDSARQLATERVDRLRQLSAVIDRARGDDPSIADRASRLEAIADECDRLVNESSELLRLQDAVAGALERAEEAAAERDIDSMTQIEAAALADDEVSRLEDLRARHDAERATVAELLSDPELASVADVDLPDLASAEVAAALADERHAAAVARHAAAADRLAALRQLESVLAPVLTARAPLAARHRVLDHLARLAEGKSADNRLRMSLSGYVLAARLEQVAVAAGERLERMSGGRYTLVHRADAGAGRSRGGLTLRILDAWTGTERDTATLSGGESFFASLALALGLADVVVAEAGGSLLETLFVDEGFGSLDDETLDEVMGVLDGLRDGGRLVGVVSHVADLRQRIPAQLFVRKGRHGSTVSQ